jgi:porin
LGIGAEIAQTGAMGPSIFPNLAYGLRIAGRHSHYYWQAALLNAVSSNLEQPYGTHPTWSLNQGVLTVLEGGEQLINSKVAVGVWSYSEQQPYMTTSERGINWGAYLLYNQQLSSGSIFGRLGYGQKEINQFDWNLSLGGQLPLSEKGILGVALNTIHASSAANFSENQESVLEFTYHYQWNSNFELQPDIQYIIHPGLDRSKQSALIFIQRLIVTF